MQEDILVFSKYCIKHAMYWDILNRFFFLNKSKRNSIVAYWDSAAKLSCLHHNQTVSPTLSHREPPPLCLAFLRHANQCLGLENHIQNLAFPIMQSKVPVTLGLARPGALVSPGRKQGSFWKDAVPVGSIQLGHDGRFLCVCQTEPLIRGHLLMLPVVVHKTDTLSSVPHVWRYFGWRTVNWKASPYVS